MKTGKHNRIFLEKRESERSDLFPYYLFRGENMDINLDNYIGRIQDRKYLKAFLGEETLRKEEIGGYIMSKYNAHELMTSRQLTQMELGFDKEVSKKKIIAVAGAKGGVGKSVFAANLAVYLSTKGFRTVIIDLDLGGANVHLYLGKSFLLKQSIIDFLKRRVDSLEDIKVKSDYGPYLIGGSSSELGTANIEFKKKMRLIKAIGNIEADYIILDLGGDMSLNSLDFYLQAHHGIVVTTPESASYMSSYHFIREALYRKLRRLFGPESKFRNERDINLEKLIHKMTQSTESLESNTIEGLVEKVRQVKPESLKLINQALADVRPSLVLNKVPQFSNIHHVPSMIQEVSRKWLSKEVMYLGEISAQIEIEASVLDQVPVIARYPHGRMAMEMENIVNNLLYK